MASIVMVMYRGVSMTLAMLEAWWVLSVDVVDG
jgi:hypothetical protein